MDLIIQDIMNGTLSGKDQFIDAIRDNNSEMISLLLGLKLVDINFRHTDENTPLMMAATQNYIEIVKMLIDNGADPNLTNNTGKSALIFAAFFNYMDLVKFLVKSGTNLDLSDKQGRSALIIATSKNYNDIARFLVENGANLDLIDANNKTALDYITDDETLKNFILSKCSKKLIDNYATEISTDKYELALVKAAKENNLDIVTRLLQLKDELKLNINYRDDAGCTALFSAVMRGYVEVVRVLADYGANTNIVSNTNNSALHRAIFFGYTPIVKILVDHGAKIDKINNGMTPLMLAAYDNLFDIFKILVDACDNIDSIYQARSQQISNTMRKTINDAILKKQVTAYINKSGVDTNSDDKYELALMKAVKKNNSKIVSMLVKLVRNVDYRDGTGCTALMTAAIKGFTKIVKILVGYSNIHSISYQGNTALSLAAIHNHMDIVKILLNNGAIIDCVPLDCEEKLFAQVSHEYLIEQQLEFTAPFEVDPIVSPPIDLKRPKALKFQITDEMVENLKGRTIPFEVDHELSREKLLSNNMKLDNNNVISCDTFQLVEREANCEIIVNPSINSMKSVHNNYICIDTNGKEYPLIDETEVVRLIYKKSLPRPKFHNAVVQPIEMLNVKCWINKRWTTYELCNRNIEIQVPKDKNFKVEYHVLSNIDNNNVDNEELYIKFPSDLIISVKNDSQPLGDVYRV